MAPNSSITFSTNIAVEKDLTLSGIVLAETMTMPIFGKCWGSYLLK